MKHFLVITESFRRAGLNTMYRGSLASAVMAKKGITFDILAALLNTSRESVRIGVLELEKKNFVYTEKVKHKKGYSVTHVYPTPYLKDTMRQMRRDFEDVILDAQQKQQNEKKNS